MGGLFELSGFGLNSLFLTAAILLLSGRVGSARLRAGLWALPFVVPLGYLVLEAVPDVSGFLGFRLSHLFWRGASPLLPAFLALDMLGVFYALLRLRPAPPAALLSPDDSLAGEWRVALRQSGLPPVPILATKDGPPARVVGLWQPQLRVVPERLALLSPGERLAVFLHEAGHLKHRDLPLLHLLHFWRASHPWLPWLPLALNRFMMAREEMADDHAVGILGTPLPLARALLILVGGPAEALAAGGGDALERIERLLGCPRTSERSGRWLYLLLVLGFVC